MSRIFNVILNIIVSIAFFNFFTYLLFYFIYKGDISIKTPLLPPFRTIYSTEFGSLFDNPIFTILNIIYLIALSLVTNKTKANFTIKQVRLLGINVFTTFLVYLFIVSRYTF
jgi:hypothetical protein